MEQLGAMFEESEFMTQLLGEFFPETEVRSNLWPAQTSANVALIVDEDNFVYSSDPSIFNVCFSPQETSTYSSSDCDGDIANFLLSSSQGTDCQLGASGQCYYDLVDFGFEEDENMSSTAYVCTGRMMQLDEGSNQLKDSAKFEAEVDESVCNSAAFHGTKLEIQVLDEAADSRKRPHNAEAQKSKRNVKPRKSKKVAEFTNTDEDKSDCGGLLRQTSSSNCLLDDDSVGGAISNLTAEESSFPPPSGNGKARASRGSATDPQSLYARKRREKINERLRILQGLVPNGTKVDISTMLDEAVQYVKFLQLQIKLLSSDDMWMYAPLAYNGMDLGLDLKI